MPGNIKLVKVDGLKKKLKKQILRKMKNYIKTLNI